MESVIIRANGYFPHHFTPLYNLNEGSLENTYHGKILIYRVFINYDK